MNVVLDLIKLCIVFIRLKWSKLRKVTDKKISSQEDVLEADFALLVLTIPGHIKISIVQN